jgi:hypothetical protein
MDLIFGLVIAVAGVLFMYWQLTPDNTPENLGGYFFKIILLGLVIVAIGFGLLYIF